MRIYQLQYLALDKYFSYEWIKKEEFFLTRDSLDIFVYNQKAYQKMGSKSDDSFKSEEVYGITTFNPIKIFKAMQNG